MTDLDKAREWAESVGNIEGLMPGTRATVEVIQSLPNAWVDAEKLREVVSKYEGNRYISEIVQDFADLLPVPKLPTLADMTQEERAACVGMQAQTWHEVGVVVLVDEMTEIAKLITRTNGVLERKFKDVTPLPDLPKLQWPGSEVVETHELPEGMRLADHAYLGRVVVSPKDDLESDYRVFCSQDHTEYGADWGYAHKSELTFLDGDQHV